jgi:predicted dehydrogenase
MKWGILGTSFISGVLADAIKKNSHSELYAVAGRTERTLNEFADTYKPSTTYSSYDALIADEQVDVVYIALPNHLHHNYVVKAAEAGKAILCEKSLSVDMEKTEQALHAVERNDVFFAEGLMYLCHPLVEQILNRVKSGEIGEIKMINASYVAAISQFVNPSSKGALYNLGCYPISLTHLLLQACYGDELFSDYELAAFGRKGEDGNICESTAIFRFPNKVTVQVHTAEDYGLKHDFKVLGSKGCITLSSNPWLPAAEKNQLLVERYEQDEQYKQQKHEVTVESQGDGFDYQVKKVCEAIQRGAKSLERPSATPKDSHQIMKLLTDWERASAL